jgi:nitric oxide reductase subunit C
MAERLTKSAARNVFYGGSAFFFAIFLGLTAHSHYYMLNTSTDAKTLTDSVARGKHVWEKHSCINCHTLLGEGAYFAPEVGNVWDRWGGREDPATAKEILKSWMQAQPSGAPGRRQMPQFNLTDQELNDLSDFLQWTDSIKRQNWPPNKAG